jgi:hypothetical protein
LWADRAGDQTFGGAFGVRVLGAGFVVAGVVAGGTAGATGSATEDTAGSAGEAAAGAVSVGAAGCCCTGMGAVDVFREMYNSAARVPTSRKRTSRKINPATTAITMSATIAVTTSLKIAKNPGTNGLWG